MKYTRDELKQIFEKTAGRCHLSWQPLDFDAYGDPDAEGGWEVDHSRARNKGGSDYFRNLLPAAISLNRSKQDRDNRTIRKKYGHTRKPMSNKEREDARGGNAVAGGLLGLLGVALLTASPVGWIVGAVIGSTVGYAVEPE